MYKVPDWVGHRTRRGFNVENQTCVPPLTYSLQMSTHYILMPTHNTFPDPSQLVTYCPPTAPLPRRRSPYRLHVYLQKYQNPGRTSWFLFSPLLFAIPFLSCLTWTFPSVRSGQLKNLMSV